MRRLREWCMQFESGVGLRVTALGHIGVACLAQNSLVTTSLYLSLGCFLGVRSQEGPGGQDGPNGIQEQL